MAKALPVPDVAADTPIGEFAARVIETRAGEVAALAAKRSNGTPRGVHDRRVAIRRLRTALEVFEPELPKRSKSVRKELKGAFSGLGPRRDADVALELVHGLEPALMATDKPGWRGVVTALEAERTDAPSTLDRDLVTRAGEEAAALAAKAAGRSNGSVADKAMRRVVGPRLSAVRDALSALERPKDAHALHELRIDAKRLRYVLEAGEAALGPGAEHGSKAARDLQTLLGDIHDLDVLLPWLRKRRRALRRADVAAVREGRRPPNAAQYRGLQTVDTMVRARRADLSEQAVTKRARIADALDRAAEELGLT